MRLFRFSILCMVFVLAQMSYEFPALLACVALGLVFQYQAKRLAGMNVSEMTYSVSSRT